MIFQGSFIQFQIINTYPPFIIIFRHNHQRRNLLVVRNWVNEVCIQQFLQLLFHNFPNIWIHPSLRLSDRFTIFLNVDVMYTSLRTNSFHVSVFQAYADACFCKVLISFSYCNFSKLLFIFNVFPGKISTVEIPNSSME